MPLGYPKVFLSYSAKDEKAVSSIADDLASHGVPIWRDKVGIAAGALWAEKIVKALQDSQVLLLVCSDAALHSRAVLQEVQLAWKYDLVLIPVLLEPTSFPDRMGFFLEGRQSIPAFSDPQSVWIPRLLAAIRQIGSPESGTVEADNDTQRLALEQLFGSATFTDRVWPLIVEDDAVGENYRTYYVRESRPADAKHSVRLGSRLFWAIEWDEEAHLLMLNEEVGGTIYCLSPSRFVPDARIRPGVTLLPPEEAKCEPFVLTGVPGRERVLAVLTTEPLDLDWAPRDGEHARVLNANDLAELISKLKELEPNSWAALATHIDVIVA